MNIQNDAIIFCVFNDGMYELAKNHLTSLKNQNIQNYIAYTTGKKSFESLKEEGFNVTFLDNKAIDHEELPWCKKSFLDLAELRFIIALELLKNHMYVWYLDIDTVIMKNLNQLLAPPPNIDIIFQDDVNMLCTGCILFIQSDATKQLLNIMNQNYNKENNKNINDQTLINKIIQSIPIKVGIFPRQIAPNGLLYFDEEFIGKQNEFLEEEKKKFLLKNPIQPEHIYLIHANYMTGSEKKIKALKKKNLWFI
jgi:hypothetical protein